VAQWERSEPRRVDEHYSPHLLRPPEREVQRYRPTHGVAYHVRALDLEHVQAVEHIAHQSVACVRPAASGFVRQAMTPKVQRDYTLAGAREVVEQKSVAVE
jgi:hypothetical protein